MSPAVVEATPGTTGPAAGGNATTTTPAPAPPIPGAATPATAPLTPAAPGTYHYDTSGTSRFGNVASPFPAVTTLIVDPAAGTTQHATRDLRDASRNGAVLETVLDYRPDGIALVSLRVTATFLLFTEVEELHPPTPVLLLPTGFREGLHRDVDLPAQAGTAHLTIDVLRQEQLTIGGQSVTTNRVHLVASIPGQLNGRLDLTLWVASAYRLWVREHSVGEATGPDGSSLYHSEYDATLQRLTPA